MNTGKGPFAYPPLPPSPDRATEAELLSPGRPQSARISSLIKPLGKQRAKQQPQQQHHIPEEMYNLFQLAEVNLYLFITLTCCTRPNKRSKHFHFDDCKLVLLGFFN